MVARLALHSHGRSGRTETSIGIQSASGSLNPQVLIDAGGFPEDPVLPEINTNEGFFKIMTDPQKEFRIPSGYIPASDPEYCFHCDTSWSGILASGESWRDDAPGGGPYLHSAVPELSGLTLITFCLLGLLPLRRQHT